MVNVPAHPVAHLLSEHTIPAAHAVPQVPQFFASEVVSTHVPEQVATAHPHVPFRHCCPAAQVFPHAPQLAMSLAR